MFAFCYEITPQADQCISVVKRKMNAMRSVAIIFHIMLLISNNCKGVLQDFAICHDNYSLKPADGILKEHTFTWLGFVQYTHVTTGLPHHSKAPRIVLIHKQFALGTAVDLLHLPKNYKLGNVVFGDYERDEEDCGLTREQIRLGVKCPKAYMETPIVDITPHPEFSRFGVGNSLALVKLIRPLKSHYMLPVCLPSLSERLRKKHKKVVFMVDYISTVPRDFDTEKMGKKSLKLYTHKDCRRHRMKSRLGSEGVTHVLCTSGCGVRPGAPIISHSAQGQFELIGLAAGGAPCSRRAMRQRLNVEPPLYVDVYPYYTWIVNVITAHILPRPFSHNFKLTDAGSSFALKRSYRRNVKKEVEGWKGRAHVTGSSCFRTDKKIKDTAVFYSEQFEVIADPAAKMHVVLKVFSGEECTIICARVLLPNRSVTPKVTGIPGFNVTIEFGSDWFPFSYYFTVGLTGRNTTEEKLEELAIERLKQQGIYV